MSIKGETMTTNMTNPEKGATKPVKQNLRFQRDKDREMVKGIFRFYEVPGGSMSFVFKAYKEDPVERFDFVDGESYSIPLGVAKHLNKNGWYPVHQHALDENGKSLMKIGQKVRRFGFQSLEFIDIEDLTLGDKQIVTVEQIVP
jgi:hypothetical protein